MTKSTYKGQSKAIHVQDYSPDPSPPQLTPIGPYHNKPHYRGISEAIYADPQSPSIDERTLRGPIFNKPHYKGASQAIHVRGPRHDLTTPPPVSTCDCLDDSIGGDCPGDDTNVWDTFAGRETNGASPGTIGSTSRDSTPWITDGGHIPGGIVIPANPKYAWASGGSAWLRNAYANTSGGPRIRVTSGPAVGTADWTALIRYRFAEGPPNGSSAYSNLAMYYGRVLIPGQFVNFNLVPTAFCVADDSPYLAGAGTYPYFEAGTWLYLEYEYTRTASRERWRVWRESWTPPGWTTNGQNAALATSSFGLEVFLGGSAPGHNTLIEIDWIDINGSGPIPVDCCEECNDAPAPIDAGFLPTFRKQIGDPTTSLDSFICTMESGAMVLDWHTRGSVSVWGGELIPWSGRTEDSIRASGTNLGDVAQAWTHWNQNLEVRSGQSFDAMLAALREGRAVILQGDYDQVTGRNKCQSTFEGNHAISVYPYLSGDQWAVGDPLCNGFLGMPESMLRAYAEDLGVQAFGVTSPQKILFAVSRAWSV